MSRKKGSPTHYWTEPELYVLIDHYEQKGGSFCMELLSTLGYTRSRIAIGQMARKLELVYDGPKMGEFKPGHTPKNKGKKMSPEIYKKTRPTMFKPGCRMGAANSNYVPVGHETFRSDGYWWVKIAEKTWREKHRLFWEKHNGSIPKDHCIIFRDGNPHNIRLENLELITKAENCRRNRWGSGPTEYSLISNRPARVYLKKKGFKAADIRNNPALLETAKTRSILNFKIRKA